MAGKTSDWETSLNSGSSRFWIVWVTRRDDGCARFTWQA